jgi:hypothetical protein
LVATAWLTGQAADKPADKPAAKPAAPVAAPCSGCDSCDDCGGFFSRLRARFHRDCGCESSCDSCGGHRFSGWHKDTSCDSCDDCGRMSRWKDKFRGWFHRDCDSCCSDCGTAAATTQPAQKLDKMPKQEPPTNKLPGTSGTDKKETRLTPPQPLVAPAGSLILEQ